MRKKVCKKKIESFELSEFITKNDQELWKIILNNAEPELFSKQEHSIDLKKCLKLWSGEKKKRTLGELKNSLSRLGLSFSYELADEKGCKEMGSFPLLSYVVGTDDKVCYSYSGPFLKKCLLKKRFSKFLDECGLTCSHISPKFIPSFTTSFYDPR